MNEHDYIDIMLDCLDSIIDDRKHTLHLRETRNNKILDNLSYSNISGEEVKPEIVSKITELQMEMSDINAEYERISTCKQTITELVADERKD